MQPSVPRARSYTKGTQYSFSTHEEGITAPDNLYASGRQSQVSYFVEIISMNGGGFYRSGLSSLNKTPVRYFPTFFTFQGTLTFQARELVRRGIPPEIRGEAWYAQILNVN